MEHELQLHPKILPKELASWATCNRATAIRAGRLSTYPVVQTNLPFVTSKAQPAQFLHFFGHV